MNVDYWTQEIWLKELEDHQVFMMNVHTFLLYNELY